MLHILGMRYSTSNCVCLKGFSFPLTYVGDRKRMDNIGHCKAKPLKWDVFDSALDP